MYYILFGAILGSAFNIFSGIEMSWISTVLALIGLIGLGLLPPTLQGFYLFGVAFHTVSLYWVGHALFFASYTIGVDLNFAVPITSLLIGIILAIQFPLSLKIGGPKYWILPFILVDIARSYSATFFPWNFIGYTATLWLSSLRFIGVIGMSFFMLAFSQMRFFPPIIQISLMSLAFLMGVDHYFYQKQPVEYLDTTVKIVQTNVSQKNKLTYTQLHSLIKLSAQGKKTNFIVWPEAVVLKCLYYHGDLRVEISKIIPEKSFLILGHVRFDQALYGCLSAINHKGEIISTYDKTQLVPFGEYTPFSLHIPKLTYGCDVYSSGFQPQSLNVTPKAAPLICYEDAFGFLLKNYPDAKWIVGVSNDSWFGNSSGPYQHFHLTRCRAIEARRPFVRSTNAGISALIGPHGQVLAYIPLGKVGYLDVNLPKI